MSQTSDEYTWFTKTWYTGVFKNHKNTQDYKKMTINNANIREQGNNMITKGQAQITGIKEKQ